VNQSPNPATFTERRKPKPKPWYRSRGWWLKQVHGWHWMSAALSMIGMLAFAVTGITLNHAASIGATPSVQQIKGQLPTPLLAKLADPASSSAPLPAAVAAEVEKRTDLDPAGRPGEWSDDEVYVALPRPGGDAWVSIDRHSGAIDAEVTDRGWISWLNDLHKGRNTDRAWNWFIDVFAAACILFTLTGLVLLYMHGKPRPLTWPLVGLGFVIPLSVIIFFIH
jgi:hypothetical protein